MITRGQATLKKGFFYVFEIIYILISFTIAFAPWMIAVYLMELYKSLPETVGIVYLIKGMVLWFLVPFSLFALLLEIYLKKIKRVSRRLKKYGFLGKGMYKKTEKEST
jgi:hypothetical protein